MPTIGFDIVPCPPELRTEAIALALSELAPSQRREIGGQAIRTWRSDDALARALFVAMRGAQLCGAAWGQFQPGNTAVFWPPRFDTVEQTALIELPLGRAVVDALDESGVAMTQVLLPAQDSPEAPLLKSIGFTYLADLVYLTCERERFPQEVATTTDLVFIEYEPDQRGRLASVIERTYEGTLDCVGLGGERKIDDVIDGYLETGEFRASNWFLVRDANAAIETVAEVGVLLLADHSESQHTELIYMGLIPQARGRGWGQQIALHAQWVAGQNGAQRLVSAVDANNLPGLNVYRQTFFDAWDRRSVFLRFLPTPPLDAANSA